MALRMHVENKNKQRLSSSNVQSKRHETTRPQPTSLRTQDNLPRGRDIFERTSR